MSKYFKIALTERLHLTRSTFKIISIVFYVIAVIYGCQNGYNLFKKHNKEIISIKVDYDKSIDKMLDKYEEIENEFADFCNNQKKEIPLFREIWELSDDKKKHDEFNIEFNKRFKKEETDIKNPFLDGYGELMDKSEYQKLKEKLTPIIMGD